MLRAAARAAWFDADAFKQPVRRDRDALQSFLRATPGNVVGPHLNERSASARVRMVLQRASPEWPDLAVTAQRLHMSVSALQRHLATEGTSFQALKDQLRRDMAIVRLTSSEASLIAIAADLGFTDSTAFQRAFKVWTGSAPGAYRARSRSSSTHRGIRPIPARPRGCSRPLKIGAFIAAGPWPTSSEALVRSRDCLQPWQLHRRHRSDRLRQGDAFRQPIEVIRHCHPSRLTSKLPKLKLNSHWIGVMAVRHLERHCQNVNQAS